MPAYALAHLRETDRHSEILEHMERIQATLDPFVGRFLVHGDDIEVREGAYASTDGALTRCQQHLVSRNGGS